MPSLLGDLFNAGAGFLGNVQGSMNPAGQEMQFRQRAYNQLAQDPTIGPGDAALALSSPEAFNATWQRKLFMDQLRDYGQKNPKASLNEALYALSPQGQKERYGVNFGPPVEAGPAKAPIVYGQGQVPHLFDVGGGPSSPQQPQPSQQPAGPMDNLAALGARYKAQEAAAVKAAETTAAAQPDIPILQNRAQQVIAKLIAIRDSPELGNVVGGPLGIKGRTGPLGQAQSDLVNDIQDANNALQGDLFTSMRAVNGRGLSPGALKEMRITDLQSGRTGTLPGYKDNIDKTIKQIQDEYRAAWEARGKPDAYKPNWAATAAPSAPKFQEGQTATNRQTGQRILYTNGSWRPHP